MKHERIVFLSYNIDAYVFVKRKNQMSENAQIRNNATEIYNEIRIIMSSYNILVGICSMRLRVLDILTIFKHAKGVSDLFSKSGSVTFASLCPLIINQNFKKIAWTVSEKKAGQTDKWTDRQGSFHRTFPTAVHKQTAKKVLLQISAYKTLCALPIDHYEHK